MRIRNFNMSLKKNKRDSSIRSKLNDNLRQQYSRRNVRVIKGDTVKVVRGEYNSVEGKIEKINTKKSTLIIEGIQKDLPKGGKVKIPIHSSNVVITSLNLEDKIRTSVIQKNRSRITTRSSNKNQSSTTSEENIESTNDTKTKLKLNVKKVISKRTNNDESKNANKNARKVNNSNDKEESKGSD
ncbi:MAG: 50S ribosomal protein L24 [Nitrososphaeraceae archaeon]